MRFPLVAGLLLLAPVASAASQVHLSTLGDSYAVTYVPDTGGQFVTQRVPFDAGSYEVESRRFDITAPPRVEDPTRIAFVGDMGTDRNASAIVDAIVAAQPDLVLLGGDLAYAHGNDAAWRRWFDLMEPLASRVPVMPAFGNHEGYCSRAGGGFATCDAELARWRGMFALPGEEMYYSFEWGPARVTVLDSEAYMGNVTHPTRPDAQRAFLAGTLEADEARWDIVMFHRPLRTTNAHEGADDGAQREALGDALDGPADLVLQAHVHAYERAKPTRNGTVLVTSGGGGRTLYDDWLPMEPWVAARAAEHHFLLLEVTPTRIEARALRPDGTMLDAFLLEKPAAPSPASPAPPSNPEAPTPTSPSASPPTGATPAPTDRAAPQETRATPSVPPWSLVLVVTLSARRRARRVRG